MSTPSESTIALLSPDGLVDSPAFSHVAVIPPDAATVLVGGQNGVDGDGRVVADDVAGQTAKALDNLEVALAAAGAKLADVVQVRVQLVTGTDVRAGYAEFQQRWDPDDDPPLVTATMVDGLGVPGALVEIDAVAALASRTPGT